MKIPLTQGKYALVDKEDYDWLIQWNWYYARGRAVRTQYLGGGRKHLKNKQVFMHREIMKTPPGMHTDHINRNPLDNRRSNLRICTPAENRRNNASKGISWDGYNRT